MMTDMLVLLRIDGDWHNQGFQVVAEIGPESDTPPVMALSHRPHTEVRGQLPANVPLWDILNQWQKYYRDLKFTSRIKPREIRYKGSIHFVDECKKAANVLVRLFRQWLTDEAFRPVENQMRSRLNPTDSIRVLIRTSAPGIDRLPWHLWDWMEEYPKAGLGFSPLTFTQVLNDPVQARPHPPQSPSVLQTRYAKAKGGRSGPPIRILAILGDATGIDVERDRVQLQSLADAEVIFLVEPDRQVLTDQLWEQQWDILFFAGHSRTDDASEGRLFLNPTESLTLEELKYGLKRAIAHGLQLAIFNSCDGVALVGVLERLNLPQFIVMQEPIPDIVAHTFLTHFLKAFAQGVPLHLAKRQARERLQALEKDMPCASWLPQLYQHAAMRSMTWRSLLASKFPLAQVPTTGAVKAMSDKDALRSKSSSQSHTASPYLRLMVTSGLVTLLLSLVRWFGGVQSAELGVYDQFTRLQPQEPQDERLLIVTIDSADLDYQRDQGMDLTGSLSPQALDGLLQKLKPFTPVSIGLDIYEPTIPTDAGRNSIPTFGICKVPTQDSPGIGPSEALDPNYVGFSDFTTDGDSILRRQLLAFKNPAPTASCTAGNAFNLLLALHYLEVAEDIFHDLTPDREFQFKQENKRSITWERLTPNAGGYQGVDAQGYQLLLRSRKVRSLHNIAPTIPLRELLTDQVAPEVIQKLQGRIVLVGVTDVAGDVWLTPHSQGQIGAKRLVPGVMMQAQMVSQLLSSVLDQRTLIWWWPEGVEVLWIGVWSGLGGAVGLIRQRVYWLSLGAGLWVGLWGISFIIFQVGGWIPVVPGAIAFALSLLVIRGLPHLRNGPDI